MTRIQKIADIDQILAALPADEIVSGEPATSTVELARVGDTTVGLWTMTEGAARDTEVDEVFLVLAGRAEIVFLGTDERIEVGVGDFVTLKAGERTEWLVHEALTKLWVA